MVKRLLGCTHVTSATPEILTAFPHRRAPRAPHGGCFFPRRTNKLVHFVIEATVVQVPVDSRGLFVNSLHLEALRLGFCGVLEENFGTDGMRLCTSGTECGELTIVKVRNRLQSVTIGVEHLWPTETTGGVWV